MSSARIESRLGEGGAYVDTSAFAKLILDEPESAAMKALFARTPLTSSAVLVTEFLRAVRRENPDRTDDAIERLDAIHLVTALMVHPYVSPLITYDRRLAAAAEALGLEVASPR